MALFPAPSYHEKDFVMNGKKASQTNHSWAGCILRIKGVDANRPVSQMIALKIEKDAIKTQSRKGKILRNVTKYGYRLMSFVPGKIGYLYLRKHSQSRRVEVKLAFEHALEAAQGKVCIDLGANLGEYTLRMANVASRVLAFEPDPWTAAELREVVSECDNVDVFEAAAGTLDSIVPLFRSQGFGADPHIRSLSSSLLAEKKNVSCQPQEYVRVIDFCRFLEELDSSVALLKIDIEGGEVALLEQLLEHPALNNIESIFVETYEMKIPSIAKRSKALRKRVKILDHPKFEMDWL